MAVMPYSDFEWDHRKDAENLAKHGVPFSLAQFAFSDPKRVIAEDAAHSGGEPRYFCFGQTEEASSPSGLRTGPA